jgi:hypothetical protein
MTAPPRLSPERLAGPTAAASSPGAGVLPEAGRLAQSSPASRPPRLALIAPQDEPDAVTSARDSDEVTETGVPGRLQTARGEL